MKNLKRTLALGLSGVLLAGALAGCAPKGEGSSPAPTGSASPSPAAAPADVSTEDMIQKLVGIPRDSVIFTADGVGVSAEIFYYWLGYMIDSVGYYSFGDPSAIDWTLEEEGRSISQYLIEAAKQNAMLYSILESKAAAEGISLTDEDKADLDSQIAQTIEKQGGADGYAKWLQQIALSDAGFRRLNSVNYLYGHMEDVFYGENGTKKATDADLAAYAEDNGLIFAKHILIKTVNDKNEPLSDEEAKAAEAKAQGILDQLNAADPAELPALFDQLMNENSEDGRDAEGNLYTPGGYLFGAGEMMQEFEDGAKALEYGQLSGLVKTDYGYHIILRLAPTAAAADMNGNTLGGAWITGKMNELADQWMKEAVVEDSPELEEVNPQAFYEALSAYRASLEPAPSETPAGTAAPDETPAPSATPAS